MKRFLETRFEGNKTTAFVGINYQTLSKTDWNSSTHISQIFGHGRTCFLHRTVISTHMCEPDTEKDCASTEWTSNRVSICRNWLKCQYFFLFLDTLSTIYYVVLCSADIYNMMQMLCFLYEQDLDRP